MNKLDEEGTLIAVLDRLRLQRLPVALALKEKVDAGGKLDPLEIALLEQQLAEARDVGPVADRHPELQEFAARLVSLYLEITAKALDNERQG
jgi:hypothetical protein